MDGAVFVFSGNSWGIPENAVDIALLAGTITGPPYDPLTALSSSNSNAAISDQRLREQEQDNNIWTRGLCICAQASSRLQSDLRGASMKPDFVV